MSNGFNQGAYYGVATGSAMNSAGLIFHSIGKNGSSSEAPVLPPPIDPSCLSTTSAKWDANSTVCFQPNQTHINLLEFSLIGNVILVLIVLILRRKKDA